MTRKKSSSLFQDLVRVCLKTRTKWLQCRISARNSPTLQSTCKLLFGFQDLPLNALSLENSPSLTKQVRKIDLRSQFPDIDGKKSLSSEGFAWFHAPWINSRNCWAPVNVRNSNWALWLAELLRHYSSESEMIVMTLPLPRKDTNPFLYMAWLDMMTRNLPPVLLTRGNQEPVLTFYT